MFFIDLKKSFLVFLFTAAYTGISLPAAGSNAVSLYNQGKAAFEDKQYSQALEYFLAAEKYDASSQTLQYNIAVCFFREKKFDQAKARFLTLQESKEWSGLASYNLGLITLSQNNIDEATQWFKKAHQSQNEKLTMLADRQLKTIENIKSKKKTKNPSKQTKKMDLVLSWTLGQDSNAASLAEELTQDKGDAADNFSEYLLYARYPLYKKRKQRLDIYGMAFLRRYKEFEHLNSQVLSTGISHSYAMPAQQLLQLGMRINRTIVDGSTLADQLQGKISWQKRIETHKWTLSYQPSQYFADTQYTHIEGTQQRLEAKWQKNLDPFDFGLSYRYELNDRNDLSRNEQFSSYSPLRHRIAAVSKWQITAEVDLKVGLNWLDSQYPNANRVRNTDGNIQEKKRAGTKTGLDLSMQYKLNRHWLLQVKYQTLANEENFSLYEYDKRKLSVESKWNF